MKGIFIIVLLLLFTTSLAYAGYAQGYYSKKGTYVSGYNRSNSNYTVRDNYSYKGNHNPYTNKVGTNYYRSNPTSQYYGTSNSNYRSNYNTGNSRYFPSWGR